MKINPKELLNSKPTFFSLKIGKNFFIKEEFWASVKKNFKDMSVLVVGEKEFTVKNLANLKEGETIKLLPRVYADRVELEILERVWEVSKKKELQNIFSKTSLTVEEFLENSVSNSFSNLENIISLLKTFFPNLDWDLKTPYFFWDWEEGRGEGFFLKEEQKLFLKIFRPILGKIEILIRYFMPNAQEMEVFTKIEKPEVYSLFMQNIDSLRKYFIEEGILVNKFVVHFQSNFSENRGWKA